jgi:type II secretory pathway pseudopilin PulG
LVELLVAIAVLALVVFPTMEVFITATKTNSKSRTELQATITANSVMEGVESINISDVHSQCNGDLKSFSIVAGRTQNGVTKSFADSGGTAGTLTQDSSGNYQIVTGQTFVPDTLSTKSTYSYAINGIWQSNNSYDAVVILEESDYNDLDADGKDTGVKIKSSADSAAATFTESSVSATYSSYTKMFNITVYVYKHEDTPVYVGTSSLEDNCLVKLTGNKRDQAK